VYCKSQPQTYSDTIAIATDGSLLVARESEGEWTRVLLPDGRTGWLPTSICISRDSLLPHSEESIRNTALAYLGIPYLWGGTSSLNLDCSGLTQLVFRLHGLVLPRNSFEQAQAGREIDIDEGCNNLRTGDLLFFAEGKRIDHAALSLGGAEFVHASMSNGRVAIESLDPNDAAFNEKLAGLLRSARRVIRSI